MRSATITQAKNGLSALIDQVRAGHTVVILDRGVPVARLAPVESDIDQTGRIARLQRAGIVKGGGGPPPVALIRRRGPRLADGASLVDAVIEERRTGP